jgi:hypothetical protein
MTNTRILLAALILFLAGNAFGQLRKTIHQSFDLPDSTKTLVINFPEADQWKVELWAGNSIMTESDIKMYSATKAIFNFFVEKGRYNYLTVEKGDSLAMVGQDPKRQIIKAGEMECSEEVLVRIFIPDTFEEQKPGTWARELVVREGNGGKKVTRKKLNREGVGVSDELQKAVNSEAATSDSLSKRVIQPTSMPVDTTSKEKDNDKGTGN